MTLAIENRRDCQISVGDRINANDFECIRRKMMLEFCKWDGQIGDVCTLADFPLILGREQWAELSALAEAASVELVKAEGELLSRPELYRQLGLPRTIRNVLRHAGSLVPVPSAVRVMRFDFHPTPDGWRVSEVNSDVPGGFSESSSFARLMGECCGMSAAGDPAARWADAIAHSALAVSQPAALLYATGYLEDMQIMAHLRDQLHLRGVEAHLAKPEQLYFENDHAHLSSALYSGRLGAVVRFFQVEWLARLPERHWAKFFVGGRTAVGNPATTVLTESKRFALVMDELETPLPTWRLLLPETRDPHEVAWQHDDRWIVKTAFCNTGDTVCMRELLTARAWRSIRRSVKWNPGNWVAQRRFETVAIDSPAGPVYPCIGVYTIDGTAAGIYARVASGPLIDFAAVDAAVLLERES